MGSKRIIYSKEKLEEAVIKSLCFSDVCRYLGIQKRGSSYQRMKKFIDIYNIDISHFVPFQQIANKRSSSTNKRTPDEIFSREYSDREYAYILRRALIESGIKYECSECKNNDIWNGKKIVLQVDHMDGNPLNNKKENLRFLCPNCHSQTETFGSKNIKR